GHLRGAALKGFATRMPATADLISALESEDRQLQDAAAEVVRSLRGRRALGAVAAALPDLPASAQVSLIHVMADRGDPIVRDTVTTACGSDDAGVRAAALAALGSLGDATSIPALLKGATGDTERERAAARKSLVSVRGATVDEVLMSRVSDAPAQEKSAIISTLAARNVAKAAPTLLGAADSENRQVRRACVDALRALAATEHIPALVDLLVETEKGERGRARRMLVAVANRCEAQETASQELVTKQSTIDDGGIRSSLLLALGDLGQDGALPTLRQALHDDSRAASRAAIVALSGWPNAEPMPDLLEVARDAEDKAHRVLALRGYIHLVGSARAMAPGERLHCYKTAMDLASEPAEKKKVLAVLPAIKTVEALRFAQANLSDDEVRQEAALAAVSIAKDVYAGNGAAVKTALERVVAANIRLDIKEQAQQIVDEIEAARSYLLDWQVAGPYMQEGKNCTALFDIPFGPERKEAQAPWRKMPVSTESEHRGYLDLLKELNGGEQRVAYLRTRFASPQAKAVTLEIFSDDGVKAWLNGKVVHANNATRPLPPAPDKVPVTLNKGVNRLMLKVTQNNMPWGAIVRVKDRKAPEPKVGKGFKVHTINADSRFEAAGILDVNRDGQLDIFCGGFWYEAPDWQKHFVRAVKEQADYYYDFANLPMDIDGDGWTDIANAAWHNKLVFWVRNPGQTGGPWAVIDIDTPGNMETAMAADINGDGQLDVLPNIMKAAAWYEFHRDASAPHGVRWEKHVLPQEAAGHGLGHGDVNLDGRCDIVTPRGWLEQLADGWQWHGEFELGHASIPILLHDVDADGDADIIWGLGHGYGLSWLEQTQTQGKRSWAKHLIDDSWSQPHFMLMTDLDNDGRDELVTGKRYHAHNGKDPGGNDPVCVYYYDFDRAAREWTRHPMHEGGRVGFGINTAVADMDGDGDIDVVAPGKSGLYLFENLLK
ncbi:MAG: HEAT repeat domain-containing protein, partial [Planctomycetota bacterium]